MIDHNKIESEFHNLSFHPEPPEGFSRRPIIKQAAPLMAAPKTPKTLHQLMGKYAVGGKVETVMHEFKQGKLHSGSKKGPAVVNRKQAVAIALAEKRKFKAAQGGSWWAQLQQEIADMGPAQQGPLSGGK